MSSSLCLWSKGAVRAEAFRLGAVAFGCSRAEPVSPDFREKYEGWISAGCNASMAYLERYGELRFDPRLLMPGAKTVISLAFPYAPPGGYHHPFIADYALGRDYHMVLRERLTSLAHFIFTNYGAVSRPCVDSAPIPERYWAHKSGLGWIGLNGQLIVPGVGSGVFLAELVTTLELHADYPLPGDCGRCGACLKACPGGSLAGDSTLDARRCHSYLSIEHRGELPADARLGSHLYGCDVCRRVCPHNSAEPPEPLPEFYPDPRLLHLDRDALGSMTSGEWRRLVASSAMSRVSLKQMKRNMK